MGHTDGLSERMSSEDHLLSDPETGSGLDDEDTTGCSEEILYSASFEELANSIVQYDTIIWLSISLLLVLAWGVGVIMLLYIPFRRYVLKKDISSRRLYLTPNEIVYKVSRPSFLPFWGIIRIDKHVPLSKVIDIIIEQGCLQSMYGLHTFRVESIALGKAAPVDELQIQGLSDPSAVRKVIILEASKIIQDISREGMTHMGSLTEGPAALRSPSKTSTLRASPHYVPTDRRGIGPGELFLHKLEEVNKLVKNQLAREVGFELPQNDLLTFRSINAKPNMPSASY